MNIVHNNESKKFLYAGLQAHAPSEVFEGAAGVDVVSPGNINDDSKNVTFELMLSNDLNNSGAYELNVDFGDGEGYAENITVDDDVMVFIAHDYDHAGEYGVNFSAGLDSESVSLDFGVGLGEISRFFSNGSENYIDFTIENGVAEEATGVSYNCTENVEIGAISGYSSVYNIIGFNFSYPGPKTIGCSLSSDDGNDNGVLSFNLRGVEVEDYDILSENVDRRVIAYDLYNHFNALSINVTNDGQSDPMEIGNGQNIMVIIEDNLSSDGLNDFTIDVQSDNYSSSYVESFLKEGVSIENYYRYNGTIFVFDVRNRWLAGNVEWNLSDIGNETYLDNDETVMVMIERNVSQGLNEVAVTARRESFTDRLSDDFSFNPLNIVRVGAFEAGDDYVSEIMVEAEGAYVLYLDTGEGVIESPELDGDAMVFIETNYSSPGAYGLVATVNDSEYNDTETGVIMVD